MSALVEHLFEELELRRDGEGEDQQGADQRLEQHYCVLLFSKFVVGTIVSVVPNVVVGIWYSCSRKLNLRHPKSWHASPQAAFSAQVELQGSCERKIARDYE